jgi:hypothetical protein
MSFRSVMASALAWWVSQVAACLQLEEFEEKEIVQDQQARIATMYSVTETKLAEITYRRRSWLVPGA